MKKILISIVKSISPLLLFLFLLSCKKENTSNDNKAPLPNNLSIKVNIIGSTLSAPYGDGSGQVTFQVNANNATAYQLIVLATNDVVTLSQNSGEIVYQFKSLSDQPTNYALQLKAVNANSTKDTTFFVKVQYIPQLVFQDEFEYTGLPDATKWSYDTQGNASGWGNNEKQYYTDKDLDNAFVENGMLHIKAIQETIAGKTYTSARLLSKKSWLYGKIEVRAKLPTGKGTWPAIWMLPTDWAYGDWPKSGEIDIMENVGYDPNTIVGSAHTEKYNHTINTQKNATIQVPTCFTDFHIYRLEWEKNEYRLYVDGVKYFTFQNEHISYKEWPFDKQFHLLLNLAIGGNWGGQQGIDNTIFPLIFEIDWVRVYQ